MGADLPKSALKTEVLVLRAKRIGPDWCHTSTGMIYTWEHTSSRRDTSLLLLWRRSDRQEQSISSSGMLRRGTKTSSSRTRKSSPSRSSTTTRMIRFMLKHLVKRRRNFQGCREAITLPMSWFGEAVSHHGVISLLFCKKGVKTGAWVYQEDVLQGVVKPLNTTVFNGQKWVFQQDSAPAHKTKTTQEWLQRNVPAFIGAGVWP